MKHKRQLTEARHNRDDRLGWVQPFQGEDEILGMRWGDEDGDAAANFELFQLQFAATAGDGAAAGPDAIRIAKRESAIAAEKPFAVDRLVFDPSEQTRLANVERREISLEILEREGFGAGWGDGVHERVIGRKAPITAINLVECDSSHRADVSRRRCDESHPTQNFVSALRLLPVVHIALTIVVDWQILTVSMRLSRHLLILTLLAAALCSDRDAARAAMPTQPRSVPTQGLIQRLSAQLRKVMQSRKLSVQPVATDEVSSTRPQAVVSNLDCTISLQSWLLNLPPPTIG